MHRREDFFHTPEQISEGLVQAKLLAEAHELTADERVTVLPALLNLLTAKQVIYEQISPVPDLANALKRQ